MKLVFSKYTKSFMAVDLFIKDVGEFRYERRKNFTGGLQDDHIILQPGQIAHMLLRTSETQRGNIDFDIKLVDPNYAPSRRKTNLLVVIITSCMGALAMIAI
mmetsp:Transcript_11116/g.9840  ORF Transcript_11116/g.9840 Transcript_11116/m.9840 type:complete len:102 (-) Transcript_11116:279-584(-)